MLSLVVACVPRANEQVQITGVKSSGDYGQDLGRESYDAKHPFIIYHDEGQAPSSMNVVRILDDSLMKMFSFKGTDWGKKSRRRIAFERVGIRPTATGTKEVWAMIRNETDHDIPLEGRVTWFDSYEGPIEGPSAWVKLYLNANSVNTFRSLSTHPDALYYMIDIREGR